VQLVSKISNLCDHKSPTSQTDGQTDGRRAIPRPRTCTKVHCAVKIERAKQPTDCVFNDTNGYISIDALNGTNIRSTI